MFYPQNPFGISRQLLTTLPILALLLFPGCQQKKEKKAEPSAAVETKTVTAAQSPSPPTEPAPEANVYVDEAMLARPYAIIGGTVENVRNFRWRLSCGGVWTAASRGEKSLSSRVF